MMNRQNVQVALMCSGIDRSCLPTKDELIRDRNKREELESKILCISYNVTDSDPFWRRQCQDVVGATRWLEDPPVYRERTPQNAIVFQTRALPYNQYPAVHSLFPNYERVSKLSDVDYFKARLSSEYIRESVYYTMGRVFLK